MSGDALASGAKSAQFGTGGSQKSDLEWDLATLSRQEFSEKYPDLDYQELLNG